MSTINEYINTISTKCENEIINTNNLVRQISAASTHEMPTISNYRCLMVYNYTVSQLKQTAKKYKLKVSGTKKELITKIFVYLKLSSAVVNVQKLCRGYLQRLYIKYHGPAIFNRHLCTNNTDFLSGDELCKLPYTQFFSYKDVDNFIYGFDIISLYNLFLKSGKDVKNPYNRSEINPAVLQNIHNLIRLSNVLKIDIEVDIQNIITEITPQKSLELRILDLFQNIDSLGNYSSPEWFSTLSRNQMIKFLRELIDIWNYRAQLSESVKKMISPPTGNPFRQINLHYINMEPNVVKIKKIILSVMENLVTTGTDKDSKSLGAYYVLGALTIVNEDAATALPWLFQSVSYY